MSDSTTWRRALALGIVGVIAGTVSAGAAKKPAPKGGETPSTDRLNAGTFAGLALRGIGPALMSGRIADIAVEPRDPRTWYVAAGSGGVWKTVNAGTTWTPVFDGEGSYSIGCVALDPQRPGTVWVGTGENVSGRHVGWGDGVYRSRDGGKSWTNLGLRASEHIAKILVDPRDSDVVLVAAEGPLWSSGGERGVYRTTDGGASWERVLSISDDTGVADLVRSPSDPDLLLAAAYQRRRHVWGFLAGGPESGIWKSTDGGASWRQVTAGLPEGDKGKIGLAYAPTDPRVVYATVEAAEEQRGLYRSTDGGESWEKRSRYLSNGTGPHYYQEIVASPHDADTLYQMDVWIHVSRDGGATFERLGEPDKHSDNHALVIDPADPEHLIAGCDGGLYETFDEGASWRFVANLPVTQIYKLCVDGAQPFWSVAGGTQDNGTQLGPSRTTNVHGVRNQDWTVPISADGYACQFDPTAPDTLYGELQYGTLFRFDRRSGEAIMIKPSPAPGDPPERWNWDAPVLVSPHDPRRLYFGSQRLWRSDDRGDAWRPLSGDLSRGGERYTKPFLGRVHGIDALYDMGAMSWHGNLTSISESPRQEGLLYVGTDDGLLQVSEDGGTSWRQIERPAGAPATAFVNEVKASPVEVDTVFAVLDNHKMGDLTPYLVESRDRGRSWRSLRGDLPDRHVVWSIVQDPVRPDLLYLGTEYGIFFSLDRGQRWVKLSGGAPTIAFRDLELESRSGDLVGASFGRGFFVLDDVTPLRQVTPAQLEEAAVVYPLRPAALFIPSEPLGSPGKAYQGSDAFAAENPPFGAVVTYYLRDAVESRKAARHEREKVLAEEGKDVPFPGWETLRQEGRQAEPQVVLTVSDATGEVVRRLAGPATAGFHRVAWDLRYPAVQPVKLGDPGWRPPWAGEPTGPLAPPGRYTVSVARLVDGVLSPLGEPQPFEVVAVGIGREAPVDLVDTAAFHREAADLLRHVLGAQALAGDAKVRLDHLRKGLLAAPGAPEALFSRLEAVEAELADLRLQLEGDELLERFEEPAVPSILERVMGVTWGLDRTLQAPTATQQADLRWAREAFAEVGPALQRLVDEPLAALEAAAEEAGMPWTPGRRLTPP